MAHAAALPTIIQGGMGVGVSNWRLARAVASSGHLGVVSGTGLDTVFIRRLQDGDPDGHLRRAMEAFPDSDIAESVLDRYFRPDGRSEGEPYLLLPLHGHVLDRDRTRLTALASFVEVHLARRGHSGPIGLNLLTKIQLPNLASLYGAMLGGVDFVLMGAGIPREIPGILDRLAEHRTVEMAFDVVGLERGQSERIAFDPGAVHDRPDAELKRPSFLPIVSTDALARILARKATGRVDGFIVERPVAGGHNAPPRDRHQFNERGEPVYGERDVPDLEKVADLGLPFWIAGGAGHPERLREALDAGATGVQVGTLFAYCDESGLTADHKSRVLAAIAGEGLDVYTDGRASPTGFPFKTIRLEGTASEDEVYGARERRCDLGYLRTAYCNGSGGVRFRCPAEPVETHVAKGGEREATAGRKCLCNALMANVGLGQTMEDGDEEPGLFTAGDDLTRMNAFLAGRASYTAADVLTYLMD